GGPLGESTRSEDRYGRDVMDPHEVATLPGDRAFDYAAWRAAGRPMGAAAERWLASTRQA
ncbi:MAG: hypothetical protein UHI81_06275, partial [Olegusella sp.]|nr:hypothetical protein [Olegusella sp.]